MSNPILDFFEEYRSKMQQADAMKMNMDRAESQLIDYRNKYLAIDRELNEYRRIITVMIDNDWDPVEAKLKTDENDRQSSLWDVKNTDSIYAKSALNSMLNTVNIPYTGPYTCSGTGMTGAIGAQNLNKYNTVSSAYNSIYKP